MVKGQMKLTERSDGTFYLQCRCGEIGQPCRYEGEVVYAAAEGVSLLRQARSEAFEHCWSAHRIPAWGLEFELVRYHEPAQVPADAKPFLVTTTPIKDVIDAVLEKQKREA